MRCPPPSLPAGPDTRRIFRHGLLLFGAAMMLLSPYRVAAGDHGDAPSSGVEIAIAPFLPARTLLKNYQPMRAYLEKALQQPVAIVTAPDYLTHFERLARGEYPVVITLAHSAWLAQAEAGYVPMLRPVIPTRPVLVAVKGPAPVQIRELRGKTIALPDPLAIISMQGLEMLRAAGLDPERDVRLQYFPNHSAAVNHLLAGEAAAAIVSDRALRQMPADTQNGVRVVHTGKPDALPGIVYLASPELPREQVTALTRAILEFARDTPEGRRLMNHMGYGGLQPATAADLAPIAPYGRLLKEAMSKTGHKSASP